MFLADPLFERLWHTAAWTMAHYFWVGAIVALAAAATRVALSKAPASVNYAAAMAFFGVLALAPVVIAGSVYSTYLLPTSSVATTFATSDQREVDPSPRSDPHRGDITKSEEADQAILVNRRNPIPTGSLLDWKRWVLFLPWIWLMGTPATWLLLATGLAGAERLRKQSIDAPSGIVEICRQAARRLGVWRPVPIAICDRLTSPVLIGLVRPVILLPASAISGWTTTEVEMALLHELAHVRRWDNLVNFIQRLVESALFFHPAIWIVSRWVRFERERCCDDIVVRATGKPKEYAQTLAALARISLPSSGAAASWPSSFMARGRLAARIHSILRQEQPMQVSRIILAAAIVGVFSLVAVWGWRRSVVAQNLSPQDKTKAADVKPDEIKPSASPAADPGQQEPKQDPKPKAAAKSNGMFVVRLSTCRLSPMRKATLSSARQGILQRILVQEGDVVKARQDLVAFQVDDLKQFILEVEAQKTLVQTAEADFARARNTNQRNRGAIPGAQVASLEAQVKHAQMLVAKAQSEYEAAASAARIRSPFDGVVTRVFKQKGEAVRIADPVVEVTNMSSFKVEGFAPAKYLWTIKRGDPVEVKIKVSRDAIGGSPPLPVEKETFTGEIRFVDVKLEANGKFRVWAEVANRKGLLKGGLTGQVTILTTGR